MNVLRGDFEKVAGLPFHMLSALPKRDMNVNMWTAMVSISIPLLGYVGYKTYKWIQDISREYELDYEYYYQDDLDQLMETKLDDLENPALSSEETIKVDNKLFALSEFLRFPRNYRKRLMRQSKREPLVKRVAIPYDQFDWKDSYIKDETPKGTVYMRYEPDTESFWYYTKDKGIPYKYLETVARKYVCEFNRLDVFVDIREELRKGQEALKEAQADGKEEEAVNQKTVYAKFKKYNHKNARASNSSKKRLVVKARSNRYSYRGSVEDFEKMVFGEHQGEDIIVPENVSYSEYMSKVQTTD
jgi:hypothetical protein